MNTRNPDEPAAANIERIMEMVPHRYPFLMIDRIEEFVPNEKAIAIKNVSINEYFFAGHFPGSPVMPGVLIVEAMAQTAAALVVKTLGSESEGSLVYFMSIDKARFRKPVTPGDQLVVEVRKQHQRRNVWKFDGVATVGGEAVADAVFSAMILDK